MAAAGLLLGKAISREWFPHGCYINQRSKLKALSCYANSQDLHDVVLQYHYADGEAHTNDKIVQ